MERREIVRTTEKFKGVSFVNFPRYKDPDDGELNMKLLDGLVCEDIAEQIPSKLRGSVSVDFLTLDYNKFLAETKEKHGVQQTMTEEEMAIVEQQLIDAIF